MRAVRIQGPGGPEVLHLADVPEPTPGPDELLVRVCATAVNRADLLQCKGLYPAPPGAPPDIPGLEFAGEVEALGARVTRYRCGDRVMGIVGGGAFAELVTIHEREAVGVPARLSLPQAAAIPVGFFTAFDALVLQGGLRSGEFVLIHAAGSGVGTAGSQISAALGATVLGTSRTEAKLERFAKLGVAHPVLLAGQPPEFAERVRKLTGRGADLVLDLLGGRYLPETLLAAAPKARLMLVGLLAGTKAELDLGLVLTQRIRLVGTALRSRPIEEKIAIAQAFERQMLPLFEAGRLAPVVDTVFRIEDVREAFRRIGANETFGKLVLVWSRE